MYSVRVHHIYASVCIWYLQFCTFLTDFAAVLTTKSLPSADGVTTPLTVSGNVEYKATGRFMFHKRNLYYSFYSNARPRGVQFIDLRGNILEEQVN